MVMRFEVLPPGEIVADKYLLAEPIGTGGYAVVYQAERISDHADVAVKIMHAYHLDDPIGVRRFDRETTLAARVRHRNIVRLLDFGRTRDDLPFIVFERLRGRTLKQRLSTEGALSQWRLAQVALQALRGLEAAHEAGVAHRDIKPSNIFLCAGSGEAYVRLLDFGIAKGLVDGEAGASRLTETGRLIGTPAYMAPEQVRGGKIGLTSDLLLAGPRHGRRPHRQTRRAQQDPGRKPDAARLPRAPTSSPKPSAARPSAPSSSAPSTRPRANASPPPPPCAPSSKSSSSNNTPGTIAVGQRPPAMLPETTIRMDDPDSNY